MINPSCNKYGSYTSSIVVGSSEIEEATAFNPTGPPLNLSIIASRYLWSLVSRPASSTFNLFKECLVIARSITFASSL